MKLADFLKISGMSGRKFAEITHASPQAMSRYIRDERIPRSGVMARIVAATKGAVQPNDFYSREATNDHS